MQTIQSICSRVLCASTVAFFTATIPPALAAQYIVQPGPADSKDIWTTSIYSYASCSAPGPGGGLNDNRLRVGGWADLYYSLLQFDLTCLPPNASSALLYLYCFHQDGSGTPMYLDRITSAWDWRTGGTGCDRNRLWWADRPSTTQWSAGQIPNLAQGQWYVVDITDLYNAWQNGTYPNYGLQFRPVYSFNNNFNEFYSADYGDNPALRPKLVITACQIGYAPFHQAAGELPPIEPGVPVNFGASGTCSTKSFGCALCSVASMLTSFCISMTPSSLDTRLRSVGGYSSCDMDFCKIPEAVKDLIPLQVVKSGGICGSLSAYLDEHVCNIDERVVLKLDEYLDGTLQGSHFVLVTGKNGSDWDVFDPGWRTATPQANLSSLNGHFTGFTANGHSLTFACNEVRTFRKAANSGNLCVRAHSPVEVLVRDPSGRKVGWDEQAGTNVFEIPDASYFRDTLLVDDNGNGPSVGDLTGIKTALIPAPNGGNYQIEITGTGSGAYTLELEASWPTGGQFTNVSGSTDVGITATNNFFVVVPPAIANVNRIGESLNFSFLSQTGATYFVQRKNTINETNWTTVRSVPGTGASVTFSETNSEASGFFRVKAQ